MPVSQKSISAWNSGMQSKKAALLTGKACEIKLQEE